MIPQIVWVPTVVLLGMLLLLLLIEWHDRRRLDRWWDQYLDSGMDSLDEYRAAHDYDRNQG